MTVTVECIQYSISGRNDGFNLGRWLAQDDQRMMRVSKYCRSTLREPPGENDRSWHDAPGVQPSVSGLFLVDRCGTSFAL